MTKGYAPLVFFAICFLALIALALYDHVWWALILAGADLAFAALYVKRGRTSTGGFR